MTKADILQLLDQMTLDEKIAQLTQLATPFFKGSTDRGEITGPMQEMGVTDEVVKNAGSVLGASGASQIRSIQEQHLKENRLGIPLLFMSDIVHGYETIFPVPLAIGCSWDPSLAEKSAVIAAKEAAAAGIHVTFAPMVDLVRDPRWGRVMETTGEDPYLNGEFAKAQVKGFQGENLAGDMTKVAACVKHFAAYGAPEGGRDYNTVDMSERNLYEQYLPAYKAAIEAGAEMVMAAFNTVDGIPATGNKKLMRETLRKEMDFNGILISDWGAVKELIPHGVAEDTREAAFKSIEAGIDIEMMTTCYADHLKDLTENGDIEESIIDEAVLRILELKDKLGLFQNPYRGADEALEKKLVLSDAHRAVVRQAAADSIVLLKNRHHTLPIKVNQKIALIGPFADNGDILGPWSWKGSKNQAVTLEQGIRNQLSFTSLTTAKGSDILSSSQEDLQEAIRTAEASDVVILALGEASEMSGEAGSRTNIKLPEAQLALFSAIKKTNKPVVVVLFNGRPLDLTDIHEEADAIIEAWYPGTEGGTAIGDILSGAVNPSGKLTMSFPYSAGQIPVYYNHFQTGRPKDAPDAQERYASQYLDSPNKPLYPFGYGLSYSAFVYHSGTQSSAFIHPHEGITFSVEIENKGDTAGYETVQFYTQDISGEVVRPVKELKGFKKIYLLPGEVKKVSFHLKEEQLRYYHSDLTYSSDKGKFRAYIGASSEENLSFAFTLQ